MWLWLAPLTLVWPLLHLLVFAVRFGRLPPGGAAEALVFVPMGLVSGAVLLWLWQASHSGRQRRAVVSGYLLASPMAFVGSLAGGLAWDPVAGTLLLGALPLVLGTAAGYRWGI